MALLFSPYSYNLPVHPDQKTFNLITIVRYICPCFLTFFLNHSGFYYCLLR